MRLKVLCDENIAGAVVRYLKEDGHDVLRATPGMPDEDIGKVALREKRVIITHDSDFTNILTFPPRTFFGIIRIRIDPPINAVVIASLQRVFTAYRGMRRLRGRLIIALPETFREWEGDNAVPIG